MKTPKIGLALGGGGARGFAHIGVLKRLEDEGIHPDIITGASMGALTGAVYAQTGDADTCYQRLNTMIESEAFEKLGLHLIKVSQRGGESFWHQVSSFVQDRVVINLAHFKTGLVPQVRIREAVQVAITDDTWPGNGLSLGIVATDLYTGEDVYFTEGSLTDAVMASIAIPGFLPPVILNDRTLVDGGVSQQVPIRLAREMGADFVIAVDVGQDVEPVTELDNAMAIMSQSENIKSCHYRMMLNREADFLLDMDMPGVHWSAYEQREEFVKIGLQTFNRHEDALKRALRDRTHPWIDRMKRILGS